MIERRMNRPWHIPRPAPSGNPTPPQRLPFIQEYDDWTGTHRRYFRRRGCPLVPLPGKPGSPEFMAAYRTGLLAARKLAMARLRDGGAKR